MKPCRVTEQLTMKKYFLHIYPACLVLLSACGSLPAPWQAPAVTVPAQWNTATVVSEHDQESWWTRFGDAQLDGLVEQALRTNNDFAAAVIRVRRAQLEAGLVDTNRTPSLAVGASTAVTRTATPPSTFHSSGVNAALSYEIDLWGKLASQRDTAHWEAEATASDCRSLALALIGTTARLYWQVAYLNQLLSLNAADITDGDKTLSLVRARYLAGAVSGLNTAQAELAVTSQQAQRTQLLQQRVEARHALAILFDQPPESSVVEAVALSAMPLPAVAAGLPAELLANRPDLQASELRLRATLVSIDIAHSNFYPTFSLTGSAGTASSTLLRLLGNPITTVSTVLSLPFLQWNTMQLSVRVSETQYAEALANHRQRLYAALAEVENALSARTQLLAEEAQLNLAMRQSQRAESITETRFKAGYTDLQLWLDAQASRRSVERSIAVNRLNQLNNQVNLYKALGLGAGSAHIACHGGATNLGKS
jgi:NodT family efflux transporter outer membrane factor (OMF) lipoprotein